MSLKSAYKTEFLERDLKNGHKYVLFNDLIEVCEKFMNDPGYQVHLINIYIFIFIFKITGQ